MTVPEEIKQSRKPKRQEYTYGRSNVKASWTCCIRADDDNDAPSRPRPHRNNRPIHVSAYSSPAPMQIPSSRQEVRRKPVPASATTNGTYIFSSRPPSTTSHHRPLQFSNSGASIAHTSYALTTNNIALLAELSRPISPQDEAGYIYIFWLTPESEASKPDDETASSLLDDDDDNDAVNHRQRISHALQRYASVRKPAEPKTILLKIGRAANVHRRLSQWTKQCGQNITLIRFYPYAPSQKTSSASPLGPARKVPHVLRVERLIHLELAEKIAQKDACEQCGKEHREWFEVEASKKGLKGVDEIVRRWVRWAESAAPHKSDRGPPLDDNDNSDVDMPGSQRQGRRESAGTRDQASTTVTGYY